MFEKENIYLDFNAENKEELFEKMSKIFNDKGYIKDGYLDSLLEREEKYPTGLSFGEYSIAIPHTYYEFISEEKIIFIRLKKPIKFFEMGTENIKLNVKIILMLLVKKGENQAELLSYLINKFSNKNNYYFFENETDKEKIYEMLIKEIK